MYSEPFGREKDQAGVSVAEAAWEATYSFALNSHFSLQPDIQYVMSPGGGPAPDALVLGSRIMASW